MAGYYYFAHRTIYYRELITLHSIYMKPNVVGKVKAAAVDDAVPACNPYRTSGIVQSCIITLHLVVKP